MVLVCELTLRVNRHHEEECRKKMREAGSTIRQLTNYVHNSDYEEYTGTYGHNSDYEDRGGMYARNSDCGGMFMMNRANSMSASTSNSALNLEDVWFIDSSASNHIKNGFANYESRSDPAMSKPETTLRV